MKPLLGILYGEWIRLRAIGAVAALLILGGIALKVGFSPKNPFLPVFLYNYVLFLFCSFFLIYIGMPRDLNRRLSSKPSILERTLPLSANSRAIALFTFRTIVGIAYVLGFLFIRQLGTDQPLDHALLVWCAFGVACQQILPLTPIFPGLVVFSLFGILSSALVPVQTLLSARFLILVLTMAFAVPLFDKLGDRKLSTRNRQPHQGVSSAPPSLDTPRSPRIAMLIQQCPPWLIGTVFACSFVSSLLNQFLYHYEELIFQGMAIMVSFGVLLGFFWDRAAARTTYAIPGLAVSIVEVGIHRAIVGMFLCALAVVIHNLPYALWDLFTHGGRSEAIAEYLLEPGHFRRLSRADIIRLWTLECTQMAFATWIALSLGRILAAMGAYFMLVFPPVAYLSFVAAHLLTFDIDSLSGEVVVLGILAISSLVILATSPPRNPSRPKAIRRARLGVFLATPSICFLLSALAQMEILRLPLFPVTGVAIVLAWHAWSIRLIPFRTLAFLGLASTGVALLSAAIVLQLSLDTQPIARRMLLYTAYFAGSIVAGTIWQVLWLDYQRRG